MSCIELMSTTRVFFFRMLVKQHHNQSTHRVVQCTVFYRKAVNLNLNIKLLLANNPICS